MKTTTRMVVIAPLLVTLACGITTRREREEEEHATSARLGHPEIAYTEDVSPTVAFALGFLPFGVGGFYVNRPGLAASGLLWPFSVFWLPKIAFDSAVETNHRQFEYRMMNALERGTGGE